MVGMREPDGRDFRKWVETESCLGVRRFLSHLPFSSRSLSTHLHLVRTLKAKKWVNQEGLTHYHV